MRFSKYTPIAFFLTLVHISTNVHAQFINDPTPLHLSTFELPNNGGVESFGNGIPTEYDPNIVTVPVTSYSTTCESSTSHSNPSSDLFTLDPIRPTSIVTFASSKTELEGSSKPFSVQNSVADTGLSVVATDLASITTPVSSILSPAPNTTSSTSSTVMLSTSTPETPSRIFTTQRTSLTKLSAPLTSLNKTNTVLTTFVATNGTRTNSGSTLTSAGRPVSEITKYQTTTVTVTKKAPSNTSSPKTPVISAEANAASSLHWSLSILSVALSLILCM